MIHESLMLFTIFLISIMINELPLLQTWENNKNEMCQQNLALQCVEMKITS